MPPSRPQHLVSRSEQDVLVLTITEQHLRGDSLVDALRHELLDSVRQSGSAKVVLNFQRVNSLASEAFRPLLALRRELSERGGRLVLCHLSAPVGDALRATRLMSSARSSSASFEVQPDVPAAVASLTGEEAAE